MSSGDPSTRVMPVANLREFFRDELHGALEKQQVAVEDQTEHYVVNLLTLFSRSEALYESSPEGPRLKPLVVMLSEALEAPSTECRNRGLQRLGDVSLFISGFFARSFARKLIDILRTMPGGFGTSPFDGEGIPTRRTLVIENGVLKSYLLNTYTAKKLGLQTTANASRGLAGTPGIGPGNYFLQPGKKTPKEIVGEVKEGLYVTEFLGHGANLVTGDYSRGASGLWISGGELTYPVEEITVAGSLKDMFRNISEIGSDLEFRGSVASPTIRIDGLMVGGE